MRRSRGRTETSKSLDARTEIAVLFTTLPSINTLDSFSRKRWQEALLSTASQHFRESSSMSFREKSREYSDLPDDLVFGKEPQPLFPLPNALKYLNQKLSEIFSTAC